MSFFSELSPDMDQYLERHTSKESDLLVRLREETYKNTPQSHMISGIQQGRFLSVISKILSPDRILELGTFTGYATLCMAEGLAKDGKITTLDINEELAYLPQKYFAESEFSEQIEFRLQDAREYLKNSDEIFDLVFIDANKSAYVDYFHLIKPRLKSGSVVLFDNVLWYGKVLEENPKSKMTKKIKELNEIATADEGFDGFILPLRDGIHFLRKK
jgi:O-methyltransferase